MTATVGDNSARCRFEPKARPIPLYTDPDQVGMGKMMIILRILRIQPWLGPTKLHCFGVSISFNLIDNIYVVCREFLSKLKFCVYPQLPAKIFDLTGDYKTGCKFFFFYILSSFFLYYYL